MLFLQKSSLSIIKNTSNILEIRMVALLINFLDQGMRIADPERINRKTTLA